MQGTRTIGSIGLVMLLIFRSSFRGAQVGRPLFQHGYDKSNGRCEHRRRSEPAQNIHRSPVDPPAHGRGFKSYQRKDGGNPPLGDDDPGNPTVNFHGEQRSNRTHESATDPEAKLARKGDGKEAKLSYSGNLLVENRNGLIVNAWRGRPTGRPSANIEAGYVVADDF